MKKDSSFEHLSDERYEIMRNKKTEAPFSGLYHKPPQDNKLYLCGACQLPLFSSLYQYNSGSGWPSFTKAMKNSVTLLKDTSLGLLRTEVCCFQCLSHLGHLFYDGPEAHGGLRFCINSISLDATNPSINPIPLEEEEK